MQEYDDYTAYDYDRLTEGAKLQIEHDVYYRDDVDLSDLISKPTHEVMALKEENLAVERAAYEKVRETTRDWEKAAAVTSRLNRALEYLRTPEPKHSSNKWGKDKYGNFDCISNKVYKISYRIDDYKNWRTNTVRYTVNWFIYTNSPKQNHNVQVAGQERTFDDKAAAEKYMQGRIKAYSRLFTEISPPIPKEYETPFRVYGHLLPGYTTEEMQRAKAAEKAEKSEAIEKPSIRRELKTLKSADKSKPEPKPAKKRDNPELG